VTCISLPLRKDLVKQRALPVMWNKWQSFYIGSSCQTRDVDEDRSSVLIVCHSGKNFDFLQDSIVNGAVSGTEFTARRVKFALFVQKPSQPGVEHLFKGFAKV
jgi:hypothetical protein